VYDKSGWNPGDTRKQKRLARAHGKLIEALLDFGAGTHPNAERLVGILAAELLPLAEFLGTDVNSEQQVGVHVHPASVPLGVEVAQADSEQFGDVHVHSGVPEPEAEGGGDDGEVRVNEEGCSRSQETGDMNGDEPGTLLGTKAGDGEKIAASGSTVAVLGGYPVPEEKVNSDQACLRSQELPGVIKGSLEAGKREDPDHAAGYGVALDYAGDDALDYGAFKPAVAVGDGNGNGCQAQQEDVSDKAAVLAQEAHGTDSLEVMETADPGSLPCATPGQRRRAKHPPVPIVLGDGRSGHVIAGMGERTKRTMYGVRLEDGGRADVRKKLYATPANLSGLCLVPKAWLVDGELPLGRVPEFLKDKVLVTSVSTPEVGDR
jgi:hypothetical protein